MGRSYMLLISSPSMSLVVALLMMFVSDVLSQTELAPSYPVCTKITLGISDAEGNQLMLRCQAQLEPFYFLAGLVTVLRFGALCDRSSFTSTDARATDLTTGFLEVLLEWSRRVCYKLGWCTCYCWRCLTQQQQQVLQLQMLQQQPECAWKSSSSLPPISTVGTVPAVLGSFEVWQDSSNDRV
jgi:hypothetical protein